MPPALPLSARSHAVHAPRMTFRAGSAPFRVVPRLLLTRMHFIFLLKYGILEVW
jgi:hypothetical protein